MIEEGERRVALAVLSTPPGAAEGLAHTAALAYRRVAAGPDPVPPVPRAD